MHISLPIAPFPFAACTPCFTQSLELVSASTETLETNCIQPSYTLLYTHPWYLAQRCY